MATAMALQTPANPCRTHLTHLGLALQTTTPFHICFLQPPESPSAFLHILNPVTPQLVQNITCVLQDQTWWFAWLSGPLIAPAHDVRPTVNAVHHTLTRQIQPAPEPSPTLR